MSNFSVEILEPQISILEITTSTVDTFGVNSTSSTFGIDIEQNINGEVSSVHNSIDVTATIGDDTTNIVEIERYNDVNVNLINLEKVLPTDFDFSFSVTQSYDLEDFLNSYVFDCGTP